MSARELRAAPDADGDPAGDRDGSRASDGDSDGSRAGDNDSDGSRAGDSDSDGSRASDNDSDSDGDSHRDGAGAREFPSPIRAVGASVTGRAHRLAGRNNQDAWYVARGDGAVVAVVCDGCGSGGHSEVGARLGARLVANAVLRRLDDGRACDDALLEEARVEVRERLRALADALGGGREVILSHLMFTVVGAAITRAGEVCLFHLGDGVLCDGADRFTLGPYPDNAPPYLGHALLAAPESPETRFTVARRRPRAEATAILLASDGAAEWDAIAARPLPGTRESLGPLVRLLADERYLAHPDALRRRLTLAARDHACLAAGDLVRSAGLLDDDTTIVLLCDRGARP